MYVCVYTYMCTYMYMYKDRNLTCNCRLEKPALQTASLLCTSQTCRSQTAGSSYLSRKPNNGPCYN